MCPYLQYTASYSVPLAVEGPLAVGGKDMLCKCSILVPGLDRLALWELRRLRAKNIKRVQKLSFPKIFKVLYGLLPQHAKTFQWLICLFVPMLCTRSHNQELADWSFCPWVSFLAGSFESQKSSICVTACACQLQIAIVLL